MFEFLKAHSFSFFCIAGLIWLGEVIFRQLQYKKKGVMLEGKVVDSKPQTGYFFSVFEFEYMGETLHVDSYNGDKRPSENGQTEMICYLPGNLKGVFREKNLRIQPWQIILGVAAIAYIILDFLVFHK